MPALIAAPGVEVVIEATGDAPAGVEHALLAIEAGRHVVMVNVEADALVGPLLARRAPQAAGVVYTLAYGDQPALICELVEWARLSGFEVVCAGKGTKHLPAYHEVTPATVWEHYGLPPEQTAGTQRADVLLVPRRHEIGRRDGGGRERHGSRAAGARPGLPGLRHAASWRRSCGRRATAACSIAAARSRWSRACTPTARPCAGDLRWGVYVTFAAADRFVAAAFAAYGVATSRDGRVAALWRPSHLVGLELGVSVARAVLAGEPTGVARAPRSPRSPAARSATCRAGETIDGEGGEHVYGVSAAPPDALRRRCSDGARARCAARCATSPAAPR